jgi:hypothetical protein
VSRLIASASGLDPHGLGVPELYWMRNPADYRAAADGFVSGSREGVRGWLLLCCRALEEGAREAVSIANAANK